MVFRVTAAFRAAAHAVPPIAAATPKMSTAASFGATKLAAAGVVLATAGAVGVYYSKDDQKRMLLERYVDVLHKAGVDPDQAPDAESKETFWNNARMAKNSFFASPLFYGIYNAIHRDSAVPMGRHLAHSAVKGVTGTFASLPASIVFYGGASSLLPIIQSRLMTHHGYTKEQASSMAQALVFMGIGSIVELGVEALGCGLTLGQVVRSPGALAVGTGFLAGRLGAGVLLQYKVTDETRTKELTFEEKCQNLAKMVAGTTLAQIGVNGAMQSMKYGTGAKGVFHYIVSGSTSGVGGGLGGARQLALTAIQRTAFCTLWNYLSSENEKAPEYFDLPKPADSKLA